MHNKWRNFAKRLVAGVLCAACLVSVCPPLTFAAPGGSARAGGAGGNIQLKFFPTQEGSDQEEDKIVYMLYGQEMSFDVVDGTKLSPGANAWSFDSTTKNIEGNYSDAWIEAFDMKPSVISHGNSSRNRDDLSYGVLANNGTTPDGQIDPTTLSAEQVFTLKGNFETVLRGYEGYVTARGQDGVATLGQQITITENSSIPLICTQGDFLGGSLIFKIPEGREGTGIFEGFTSENSEVNVQGIDNGNTAANPLQPEKVVNVRLVRTDGAQIFFSFTQPYTYTYLQNDKGEYYKIEGGRFVRLTEEEEDEQLDELSGIPNNFFRGDSNTVYNVTFRKPETGDYTLRIATSLYAATIIRNEIIDDKAVPETLKDTREYIHFRENEDFNKSLASSSSIQLARNKARYDALFDLDWSWIPLEPLSSGEKEKTEDDWKTEIKELLLVQQVIQQRQDQNDVTKIVDAMYDSITDDVKAAYKIANFKDNTNLKDIIGLPNANGEAVVNNPNEEDVTGLLVGRVSRKKGTSTSIESIKACSFQLTVNGVGKPGTVELFSSRTGEEPGTKHTDPATGSEVVNTNGTPRFTLMGENPAGTRQNPIPNKTVTVTSESSSPTTVQMDVFNGGVANYSVDNLKPYEYVLQLNMGLGHSWANYARITVENKDKQGNVIEESVVELTQRTDQTRLPPNMGSQMVADKNDVQEAIATILGRGERPKTAVSSWSTYEPGTTTWQYGADINNPNGTDKRLPNEGQAYIVARALREGTATVTVDFYADIYDNNDPQKVGQSYIIIFNVVSDSTPPKDTTLGQMLIEETDDNKRTEMTEAFPFTPDQRTYNITLPYAYKTYRVRVPARTNQDKTDQDVVITATQGRTPLNWWTTKDATGNEVKTNQITMSMKDLSDKGVPFAIWDGADDEDKKNANAPLKDMNTKPEEYYTLTFLITAKDTRESDTYTLNLWRDAADTTRLLSTISVYTRNDQSNETEKYTTLLTPFQPENFNPTNEEHNYCVYRIPYSTDYVRVEAELPEQMSRLGTISYSPARVSESLRGSKNLIAISQNAGTELEQDEVPDGQGKILPCLYILVKSQADLAEEKRTGEVKQAGKDNYTYRVFFEREDPSNDATLRSVTVSNSKDTSATPAALPYLPAFVSTNPGPYRMTERNALPHTTEQVRFTVTPTDAKASKIEISVNGGKPIELKKPYQSPSEPIVLLPESENISYNIVEIKVTAEDELNTQTYTFQIQRLSPNNIPFLSNLLLLDADEKEIPATYFKFDPNDITYDDAVYNITLPYETQRVRFRPTLTDANGSIRLRDSENANHKLSDVLGSLIGDTRDVLTNGAVTKIYNLNSDPGDVRTFTITGIAEDEKTVKNYVLNIDREKPSNDSLLKMLTVSNLTEAGMSPIFKARETNYSGTIALGQRTVTVTPTANEEHATIRVDGTLVASGTASQPIEILDEHQNIEIVVTAQDGKTTTTYIVDVLNQNLIEKTNNSDLKSLTFSTGQLTPNFQPAVINYELAVKEDVYSINIIPELADPMATLKVLSGSRELGDYNKNYAMALSDGTNEVKVQVTSADGTRTTEYVIKIYRNKEESLKNLTPLKKDDIDFTKQGNPITISLVEYPRIQADVFTELRDNYPEKTLVLQGVDYSLTFNASTLNTIIPQRQIYDFSMSFTSPDAENVYRFTEQWPENDDILSELVMIYFDYHGDLPGPATLNLSLSNRYGGQPLFWHYYNNERERIDYYGTVQPNAKGTFAVAINHFSTYVVSRIHPIIGAENQEGNISFINSAIMGAAANNAAGANGTANGGGGGGSATSSSGKLNPATLAEDPKARKEIP